MYELKKGDMFALALNGVPVGTATLVGSRVEYPADISRDGILRVTCRVPMPVGEIGFGTTQGFREDVGGNNFSIYLPRREFVSLDGRKITVMPLP